MTQPNDKMPVAENGELMTALVAGLSIQADKLTKATRDAQANLKYRPAFIAAGILGLLLLVGQGVVTVQNYGNSAQTRRATSTILDCTTPGGQCYERSQTSTGRAVAQIVGEINAHTDIVFLATVECSRHPLTDQQFLACLRAKGVR